MDLETARKYFNDPIFVSNRLSRLVGYTKDDSNNEYIIVREIDGKINYLPSNSMIVPLGALKGVNKNIDKEGNVWDDYTRLDCLLQAVNCPREIVE